MWRMAIPDDPTLTTALRARGQRVTPQRLAIAAALRDFGRHASAEQVFGEVARRLPGVSLPTVYSTLDLLEDMGFVRRVPGDGAAVYDPRTDAHHHLICSVCGAIADVDGPVDDAPLREEARRLGFTPADSHMVIRGRCALCTARSN